MPTNPDTAATKSQWRSRLLGARRALSAQQQEQARAAIRASVLSRVDAAASAGAAWQRVFAFEATATEPGSARMLHDLADRGVSVFVPRIRPDHDLDWLRWPGSTSVGRDAVASASALLVPALAVDRTGIRLGRGGGYYDRVLARVAGAVPVIALLHRGELVEQLPHDPWDARVSAAVTPDGWFSTPG